MFGEISLLLPYLKLALNKDLSRLYDDSWFQDKINKKHSYYKNAFCWKTLYKRSLKSGKFMLSGYDNHLIDNEFPIEGIKIAEAEWRYYQFILTFDGNLYKHFEQTHELEFVDDNVTDIDNFTYIKDNKWYYHERPSIYLIVESDESFISVTKSRCDGHYAAITKNKFYFYYQPHKELLIINSKNNVKLVFDYNFLIQDEGGVIKKFDVGTRSLINIDLPKVERLYSGCVKFVNSNILKLSYSYLDQSDHCIDCEDELLQNANIINYSDDYSQILLLIDNNVYKYHKSNKQLYFKQNNVKNIIGEYFIM